jgi:two-component system sensor histidine kinase PilS (NtrC family)
MLFVHGAAFVLTATLSSYLARLLESAGQRAKVAESSLSELHALHDSIVRSIASGILTTDAEGRISYLNRAAEEIVELPLSSIRGLRLEELFPAVEEALHASRGHRLDHRLEAGWTSPSGQAKVLGFTVTPLLADDGRRLGSATVFQDLTPYRELELQAARSERLAAVGKLAAGLAHELRNPLASISGSVELLAASASAQPDDARLLDIVLREADRLSSLVSDFLAFARPAQPQPGPVNLPSLVREVLHVFESDPHVSELTRAEDLRPAVAHADASQLKQVLWNLLLNAAQATPAGGTLRVTTGPGEPGWVQVAVADDGSGIAAEDMQRIFDPFFTTKPDGTGLGLATVHRIVDAHRGRLEVESHPGAGSCFTVHLPASPARIREG